MAYGGAHRRIPISKTTQVLKQSALLSETIVDWQLGGAARQTSPTMPDGDDRPTIHVDDQTGQDAPDANGSPDAPFKSLGYAYLQRGDAAQYLVKRKEGDEAEASYKPAAKAALKKAVNYAETQRKKAGKEKELALRQQKMDEERSKTLEEAKKIIIKEDPNLPPATKINLGESRPDVVKLGFRRAVRGGGTTRVPRRGTRVRVHGVACTASASKKTSTSSRCATATATCNACSQAIWPRPTTPSP